MGFREWVGQHAFRSTCWQRAHLHVCCLTQSFRTVDNTLLSALTDMRSGFRESVAIQKLVSATARDLSADRILPTMLYTTNKCVRAENEEKLSRLPEETEVRWKHPIEHAIEHSTETWE